MSDNEFEAFDIIEAEPEPASKRVKKTHDSLANLPHLEPTNMQNYVTSVTKTCDLQVENCLLEDLPNEILLKVLANLQLNDLIKCGHVNKRIRSIAHDEKLWQKVNLYSKRDHKLSAGLIQLVLENGCKYLGISGTIYGHLIPTKTLKLNHLVISNVFSVNTLDVILASCYSLEKLSLNNVRLSYSMISSICNQNGKTLKVLNLQGREEGGEQLDFDDLSQIIQPLIDNCGALNELYLTDFSWLSEEAIDYLVNNLTVNILKLNLNDINIEDDQLKILVTRCNKITELNLNGTDVSNESVDPLLKYLQSTLEKLDLSETQIDVVKLFELKSMKKLKVLVFDESKINILKKELPNIEIVEHNDLAVAPVRTTLGFGALRFQNSNARTKCQNKMSL